MPYHYSDDEVNFYSRPRRSSSPPQAAFRPDLRTHHCSYSGAGRRPNVNIYNRNDPHQEDRANFAPAFDRRGRDHDPAMLPYPVQGFGAMPVWAPRDDGRSRSRSRNRRDDEELRERILAEDKRRRDREEEEKDRAIERYKLDKEKEERDEEEKQREAVRRYKQKQLDDEEKERKAWEAYEAKKRAKAEAEKEKKKKEDEDYKKRYRESLSRLGWSPNQVDAMVAMEDMKLDENKTPGTIVHQPKGGGHGRLPNSSGAVIPGLRYPKIKRKDIEIETLEYYNLPWYYDPKNNDYIIVQQDMDDRGTDELFRHTHKIWDKRAKKARKEKEKKEVALVEERGRGRGDDDGKLRLVRRKSSAGRSKSRHRSRSRADDRAVRFAGAILGVKP